MTMHTAEQATLYLSRIQNDLEAATTEIYTKVGAVMAYLNNDAYFVNKKFKIKDQAMDNLIINDQEIKLEVADDQIWTTSLQIADVFEKEHKHILAKIRELPQDNFNGSNFRLVEYTDKKGESRPYFLVSKDGFTLLAMSFNGDKFYKFKIAYINAFNAMAEKLKNPFNVPRNYKEALELAIAQVDKIEALEAQRLADLPKIVFAEAVEASATSALIGDFVKTLCDENDVSVGRNRIFKWLRDEKYLMADNMPYQRWLDVGYFEVIPQVIVTPKGNKERFTTKITAKGQVALSAKIVEAFRKAA
ncbi:phage regulatory protein/antirepressor Ant [uncultured Campylobacter sp.]|uniref:phage regulatory protein/antirepressor Ant n=1 Tax=uncultured Campylobacter sp. TaxID=218934 RepID=UPI0025F7B182|nr:phage regulatory protein/antirepressor Ant [uncultured Campylobacter sp.]